MPADELAASADAGTAVSLPAPEDLPEGSAARALVERATAARAGGALAAGVRPESVGSRRGAFTVSDAGIRWTCSRCETSNPLDLQACSVCGTPFATAIDPGHGTQLVERDPGTTALVSFLYPGAGHAYVGLWGQALARGILFGWVVLVAFLSALQGTPGADRIAIVFGLAAFGLWAAAAHDAYRESTREPERVLLKGRSFLYIVLGLLVLLVLLLVQSGLSLRAS